MRAMQGARSAQQRRTRPWLTHVLFLCETGGVLSYWLYINNVKNNVYVQKKKEKRKNTMLTDDANSP
jgi:hypothetical protein